MKKYKNHVKAEATDRHPAQVEVYTEDQKVGVWSTTKFSTCMKAKDKNTYLKNVRQLIEAVKLAREAANSIEVHNVKYGEKLLDFVFKNN